jgi:iron-sulfur cluster repair protein YtfE (RIC family)
MANITLLEDRTRPKAPKLDGATTQHELPRQHLKMIHRYHLMQLAQVRRALDEIEAGLPTQVELNQSISNLHMHKTMRMFGNMCGQECEMLKAHHNIESQMLFPVLIERGNDGIKRVVERLMSEHKIIHYYLQDLEFQNIANTQNSTPQSFNALKETFLALEKIIHSHFKYEETELEVAIGFYGVEI